MRALVAKIMILVALANAFGAKDVFASSEVEGPVKGESAFTAPGSDGGEAHNEADCDNETCARHQCHLGHCQFYVSGRAIDVASSNSALHLAFPPSADMIPNEYRSSLIKPPCV
jgi:hypothetical protein